MRSLRGSHALVILCSFIIFLFLSPVTCSNKFGLSHNCAPGDSCAFDTIYCVDSTSTSAVCSITCVGMFACGRTKFVVANSGGLVLNCLGPSSCESSTIEWVNSDNLDDYTAVNSSVAIGGPLRVLHCYGGVDGYACAEMSVSGDTQEQGLGTTTEWNCAGYGSCQSAQGEFKSAVSIHCNQTQACDNLDVTCLSGGNCRAKSNKDSYSNGATMNCMPGVQHCECGNYWDCISRTFAPITTTRIQSTSLTEAPHTKTTISSSQFPNTNPNDNGNSLNITVLLVLACVITLVICGPLAVLSYFVLADIIETRRQSKRQWPSKDMREKVQLAKQKSVVSIVVDSPSNLMLAPIDEMTPEGPRGFYQTMHLVERSYDADGRKKFTPSEMGDLNL